ncbi:transglycosylase domain-containing protein [Bacillus changyiensis]|uniref:transglycosylase domain-containing protein n=1 Tax=Bacillus changyiensis TaxID=3004103 RepID=UPI0022E54DD5|nr:transglycosylase domain-containing protein [Bacillus changyiensis]MDA1476231.1 transglycosylase domain-containing protein [Bacillus changyiensis]
MTNLRAIIGWILIIILIPICALTVMSSQQEVTKLKPLDQVLDEKIDIKDIGLVQNSYMYDADGALISEIVSDHQNRVFVSYKNVPEHVKQLFLTSEDRHFFQHKGFDFIGIARAAVSNAKNGGINQGASTITQQLARNLYLSHERTLNRKLAELLYSYQLEKKLTKEEIFEKYLNTIYFNNGVYGIGSAALFYYSKPLKSLTLAEMAFICAIPNNPTLYDPLKHFDSTKTRQERLLKGLKDAKVISEKEYKKAIKEKIKLHVQEKKDSYPDYTTYVNDEFTELVSASEGFDKRLKEAKSKEEKKKIEKELSNRISALLTKGIKIHTALDTTMQNRLGQQVAGQLPYQGVEGGAVVINHQTHQIVAMSGGKHYKKYDFNLAYQGYRQPGSSIKPLLDYGPYLEETGATSSSMIDASKFCSKNYCPNNYNEKTYGTVSIKTAFKHSYNTPAVRMLNQIGVEKGFGYLEPFGFKKIVPEDHRLPAALGGFTDGFSPLEMADAYTTFANDGSYISNHAITKVTDLKGKTLFKWENKPKQVYSLRTNNELRKLLKAVVKEGTGRKANFKSTYIGGKTGTSNGFRDLWFVGLTENYTMSVWVGKKSSGNVEFLHDVGPQLLIWKGTMQNGY